MFTSKRDWVLYKRWRFLMLSAGIIIPLTVIAGKRVGLPGYSDEIALIGMFGLSGLLIIQENRYKRLDKRTRAIGITLLAIFLFNLLVSEDLSQSFSKWILFFAILFVFGYYISNVSWETIRKILPVLATSLLLAAVIARVLTRSEVGVGSTINQSIGLYAGGAVILSFAFKNALYRNISIVLSVAIMLTTGARGSLLSAIIGLMPITLLYIKKNKVLYSILPFVAVGLFYSGTVADNFMKSFAGYKYGAEESSVEGLQNDLDKRFYLARKGLELSFEHPWGFGLGDGYVEHLGISSRFYTLLGTGQEFSYGDDSTLFHTHNGLVSTILEMGWPGGVFVIILTCIGIMRLMRAQSFTPKERAIIVGLSLYLLARSMSDNYFITNGANIVTYVFDIFILIAFIRPEIRYRRRPSM